MKFNQFEQKSSFLVKKFEEGFQLSDTFSRFKTYKKRKKMEKAAGVFKILEKYEQLTKSVESSETCIFLKIEDAQGNERFLRNARIDKKNKIIYGLDEKMKGSLVAINFSSIYDGCVYGYSSTSSTCFF